MVISVRFLDQKMVIHRVKNYKGKGRDEVEIWGLGLMLN